VKNIQREEYICIENGCQQLKLGICSERVIQIEKEEFYRQVRDQLEGLDYTELYKAYSGSIRKTQVEPRILFELLVCAYAMGVYSTRKIEGLCRNHVQFLLILDGHEPPDHTTIARVRSGKATGKAIRNLYAQYTAKLEAMGEVNHDTAFIDGTKVESKANRYTFVWRKTVERELKKIKEQLKKRLPDDGGYITPKKALEYVAELDRQIAEAGIEVKRGRGHHKPEILRLRDEIKALADRLVSYEEKKRILGEGRNSYAKTDPDATFMHMKDDHMRNGQLKPGYNIQFVVNSEYITGIGVFPNRTDYATLPVLLDSLYSEQKKRYKKVVADSGYESLSNYRYLAEHDQEAYIKPNNYASCKTRKFKAQIGRAENMAYYAPGDYFLCKAGRILARVATTMETAKDGTMRDVANYRCEDCCDCPHRAACCKAKDPNTPKELEICWELVRFRQLSLDRITTHEGKLLRVNRSIQSEGSFAQLKHNRNFKRFLMGGNVKVGTELCLLALSQNIVKYISKCNSNRCKTHLLIPKALPNS
jgi:transposase